MSVFRSLFVEVPIALLEAAVLEAQEKKRVVQVGPRVTLDRAHPDMWVYAFKYVQDKYDWKLLGWARAAHGEYVTVRVLLPCKHPAFFDIDERIVAARAWSTPDLIDYLLNEIAKGPQRRCKCGTPQGLGPAGVQK